MDVDASEYVRLRNEYHVTMRVLAVLVERVLELTGSEIIELDETVVTNAPDLHAFMDEHRRVIGLKVTR